jgi:hypothetical protein
MQKMASLNAMNKGDGFIAREKISLMPSSTMGLGNLGG